MSTNSYVMGHDDRERRRLGLQATIINPITEHLLQRAGLAPGMRVLDAGCGVGEVSLVALLRSMRQWAGISWFTHRIRSK
jgi:cyclopropane fatty-acyl-phospholipid synthase-like methyltransferase